MAPATAVRYYTREESAELCDVSVDTIKRRQKAGELPNARQRPGDRNGTWEIPLTDLVNAGLYELSSQDADTHLRQARDGRELADIREQLAREQGRRETLEQIVDQVREHTTVLEGTVDRLVGAIEQITQGGGR